MKKVILSLLSLIIVWLLVFSEAQAQTPEEKLSPSLAELLRTKQDQERMASGPSSADEIVGPFLVDIDNDEDLEDALVVARKTLYLLRDEFGVDINSLRIFFTGHKGFNLEIRPQALSIQGSTYDQIRKSANVLNQITEALRRGKSLQITNWVSDVGTVVDRIYGDKFGYSLKHPYIRLHGSNNMRISSNGKSKTRMKIEFTADELNKLTAIEIASRAENLET